jgi:glycolate oxidase iron-sulfur subunit
MRPLLPRRLREQVPRAEAPGPWPPVRHARRMLVLEGCVQPAAAPAINAAAARVLDRLGISLIRARGAGCCGAMSHHLGEAATAREMARRNIDAWWPELQAGAEAVVLTASACGLQLKDYGELLADDPAYAEKGRRVSALARDMSEILADEDLSVLGEPGRGAGGIACHTPCTLQHGQPLGGMVDAILRRAGFRVTPVANPHLCCGSAGTYSLLQPALSEELRERKLADLQVGDPDLITTANIGCLLHLRKGAPVPVLHWVQLLDPGPAGAPFGGKT